MAFDVQVVGGGLAGSEAAWQLANAIGALLRLITGGADAETFQSMNINFRLMPIEARAKKANRKKAYSDRARASFTVWLGGFSHARDAVAVLAE